MFDHISCLILNNRCQSSYHVRLSTTYISIIPYMSSIERVNAHDRQSMFNVSTHYQIRIQPTSTIRHRYGQIEQGGLVCIHNTIDF